MPKAGMDMKEGVIIKWLVNVGDEVKESDALLEIETDKVTMEIESPTDGILLCKYFDDGATVPVVTVIGYVGEAGEEVPDGPTTAGVGQNVKNAQANAVKTAPESPAGKSAHEYDVAVIGGGPAGYVAAIKASQLGGKVVLFEKDTVGGTCLNRGCIPTKTYLKTAEQLIHIKSANSRGIIVESNNVGIDMKKVHDYKQKVVKQLTGGIAGLLKSRKVEVVKGTATITGEHSVECAGKSYAAVNIILCGGSKAGVIPIPGVEHDKVLTSDTMLDVTKVPKRLTVIGGGVIGCEIATAFASFGSKVTVVELMDRVVPMMDEEVSAAIVKSMEEMGIKISCGIKVEKIEDDKGLPVVCISGGEKIKADTVLLSIGRNADSECLGALADEITTENGKVIVDEACRTNFKNIYACGDLTTVSTLAHSAFKMGEVAAANAMGHEEKVDLKNVPACLYTIPEAASVGLTEEQAAKEGEILVGKFPFTANGRALASGEAHGFVKVVVDKKIGEILGVHMVGAIATEMIAEAKVLMDAEVTIYEAAEMIYAHPTYSEALVEAFNDVLDKCIHLP